MVCIFRGDTDFPRKIASAFLHLFSYTITFSGTLQHRNHSYTITYITYLSPNKPWALYNKCIIHFFVHQTRSEITPQCRNFCQIRLHRVTASTEHAWARLWCDSPETLFLFYRIICPVLKNICCCDLVLLLLQIRMHWSNVWIGHWSMADPTRSDIDDNQPVHQPIHFLHSYIFSVFALPFDSSSS